MDLLAATERAEYKSLLVVKYVDSHMFDYLQCMQKYGKKYKLMFAPEPKLAGIALGATMPVKYFMTLLLIYSLKIFNYIQIVEKYNNKINIFGKKKILIKNN